MITYISQSGNQHIFLTMSREEIKADIERHIRHCAMRHGVKQDEVVEVMAEVVYEKNAKAKKEREPE